MDDRLPDCAGCLGRSEGYHCSECSAPLCRFCFQDSESLCAQCLFGQPVVEAFTAEDLEGNLQ